MLRRQGRGILAGALLFASGWGYAADLPVISLPEKGTLIDYRPLAAEGYPHRALAIWMIRPKKVPSHVSPDQPYTCPETQHGSYFAGTAHYSLVDTQTYQLINTISEENTIVPYAIRPGFWYAIRSDTPSPSPHQEYPVQILALKDYNGDGKALEFAMFHTIECPTPETMLMGYSPKQDKLIQYSIDFTSIVRGRNQAGKPVYLKEKSTFQWINGLFTRLSIQPGLWRYSQDTRRHGGDLRSIEIRYVPQEERFEGREWVEKKKGNGY